MACTAPRQPAQAPSGLRGTSTWAKLKAAFQRLDLPSGKAASARLDRAVDKLAGLASSGEPVPPDTPFRLASRMTTKAELDKLAQHLDALDKHVKGMHAPAITALREAGVGRGTIMQFA